MKKTAEEIANYLVTLHKGLIDKYHEDSTREYEEDIDLELDQTDEDGLFGKISLQKYVDWEEIEQFDGFSTGNNWQSDYYGFTLYFKTSDVYISFYHWFNSWDSNAYDIQWTEVKPEVKVKLAFRSTKDEPSLTHEQLKETFNQLIEKY